ncbi:hypothetical protein G6L46_24840 [Agrobacterium rhizogenes]|uniref:hypothetical protein n=1 Tax=Rhizobium rhizogenes TaxID=359 RepID=UPI0015734515|nr:hypothetical protein [Rhizobium rhizogenes]NTF90382.1 hypothetical protein [Rhizobium rhizogenes]
MRQLRIVATVLMTAIGGMSTTVLAAEPAITPTDQALPGTEMDEHMMAFGKGMPFPPPHGMPGDFHRPDPALELATKLSALETLIGIHSAQLDAWRDYTSALTDFFAPPRHEPMGPPPVDGAKPANADSGAGKSNELFGEQAADRALDRAAKARVLKDKATALHNVLTPDQFAKLEDAERSLEPGPMGPGPHSFH